jgi:hypothetical protein
MAIRVPVTIVVEMDDDQQATYVAQYGLGGGTGRVPVRVVVNDVRSYVLRAIAGSAAFGDDGAAVSLK